jgi:hypothetical protein
MLTITSGSGIFTFVSMISQLFALLISTYSKDVLVPSSAIYRRLKNRNVLHTKCTISGFVNEDRRPKAFSPPAGLSTTGAAAENNVSSSEKSIVGCLQRCQHT